jgi:outer membrane autotransporter protein
MSGKREENKLFIRDDLGISNKTLENKKGKNLFINLLILVALLVSGTVAKADKPDDLVINVVDEAFTAEETGYNTVGISGEAEQDIAINGVTIEGLGLAVGIAANKGDITIDNSVIDLVGGVSTGDTFSEIKTQTSGDIVIKDGSVINFLKKDDSSNGNNTITSAGALTISFGSTINLNSTGNSTLTSAENLTVDNSTINVLAGENNKIVIGTEAVANTFNTLLNDSILNIVTGAELSIVGYDDDTEGTPGATASNGKLVLQNGSIINLAGVLKSNISVIEDTNNPSDNSGIDEINTLVISNSDAVVEGNITANKIVESEVVAKLNLEITGGITEDKEEGVTVYTLSNRTEKTLRAGLVDNPNGSDNSGIITGADNSIDGTFNSLIVRSGATVDVVVDLTGDNKVFDSVTVDGGLGNDIKVSDDNAFLEAGGTNAILKVSNDGESANGKLDAVNLTNGGILELAGGTVADVNVIGDGTAKTGILRISEIENSAVTTSDTKKIDVSNLNLSINVEGLEGKLFSENFIFTNGYTNKFKNIDFTAEVGKTEGYVFTIATGKTLEATETITTVAENELSLSGTIKAKSIAGEGKLVIANSNAKIYADSVEVDTLAVGSSSGGIDASKLFGDDITKIADVEFTNISLFAGSNLSLKNATAVGSSATVTLAGGNTLNLYGVLNSSLTLDDGNSVNTLKILSSNARITGNVEINETGKFNLVIGDGESEVSVLYKGSAGIFGGEISGLNNITINENSSLDLGNEEVSVAGNTEVNGTLNLGTGTLTTGEFIFGDNATIELLLEGEYNEEEPSYTNGKVKAASYDVEDTVNNTKLKLIVDTSTFNFNDGDEQEILVFANEDGEGSELADSILKNINITNTLYNFEYVEDGKFRVLLTADVDKAISAIGNASSNNVQVINALFGGDSSNVRSNVIGNKLLHLAQDLGEQSNKDKLKDALTALAPDATPVVQSNTISTLNTITAAVGSRLTGGSSSGLSSGDFSDVNKSVWIQGLYNTSELSTDEKSNNFESNTSGVAIGFEGKFNVSSNNSDLTVGLSYANTKADIDSYRRNTDVSTNTFILYGEYKPSEVFYNGIIALGKSTYKEKKSIIDDGDVRAKYDANTFAFQVGAGYEIINPSVNITPVVNLRYVNVDTDAYTDDSGLQNSISSKRTTNITVSAAVKFDREFALKSNFILKPEFKVGISHDLENDSDDVLVKLVNSSSYTIKGAELKPTSFDVGAGITGNISDKFSLSLSYDGQFRTDYVDNTFLFNVRFNF